MYRPFIVQKVSGFSFNNLNALRKFPYPLSRGLSSYLPSTEKFYNNSLTDDKKRNYALKSNNDNYSSSGGLTNNKLMVKHPSVSSMPIYNRHPEDSLDRGFRNNTEELEYYRNLLNNNNKIQNKQQEDQCEGCGIFQCIMTHIVDTLMFFMSFGIFVSVFIGILLILSVIFGW